MNLNLKYLLVIFFLFSLLISLSMVSAEASPIDDDSLLNNEFGEENIPIDYELNEDSGNAVEGQSVESIDEDSSEGTILNVDEKSFEDIQLEIDNSDDNSTIELDGVYTSSGNVIKVNKTLTIVGSGEGATLDGNFISRVFDLESNNIILKNLKIINSNFTLNGQNQGAVYCFGENISIFNCTFINNICEDIKSYGGAIRWEGDYGKLDNSIFINNSAYRGGAIQFVGYNYIINNSVFIDNYGFYQEGAVFLGPNAADSIVENCIFRNNSANGLCGALRACSDNNKILNCTFIDNHAGTEAGAILICNAGNNIENCTFLNNSATDGGAIFFKRTSNIVSKCIFINNSANNGAAIYNNQSNAENPVKYSIFDNNHANDKASAYYGDVLNLICNFYGQNFNLKSDIIDANLIYNGSDYDSPLTWVNIQGEKITYQNLNQAVSSSLKFILNDGADLTESLPVYGVVLSNEISQNKVSPNPTLIKSNYGQFNYLSTNFTEDAVKIMDANTGSVILLIPINFTRPIVKIQTKFVFRNMTTKSVDIKLDGKIGKYFNFTLKDKNGNVLVNKKVKIKLNGVIYNLKTNANGLAKLQINLKTVKTYYATISFAGDNMYDKVSTSAKIIVKKQDFKLYVPKKSYRSYKRIKVLTATLRSSKGHAVKGKTIVFTINKRKYIARTNYKGIATVKVKLYRKRIYKFKVRFAGDSYVNSITKYSRVKIY